MKPVYASLILAGVLNACADTPVKPTIDDTLIELTAMNGRAIPLRVLTPPDCDKCPLIIFSHGAFSTYDRYDSILLPLAKVGFKVVAPNHVDSEKHPNRDKFTPQDSLPKRLEDYELIAAKFEEHPQIAMGHSYGAMIAQLAGGAELSGDAGKMNIAEKFRPKSVIAISPPGPIQDYMEAAGWTKIQVLSLTITGTMDIVPKMTENWEDHLVSYEAAPKGKSYALIYQDMDHYMNGSYGREKPLEPKALLKRNQAVAHLTQAMIDFVKSNDLDNWPKKSTNFAEAKSR